ncbi:nuclear transport factor 2 family protein [Algoriphagus terrigena]|uniref:nuclear transport factor 2 family protein n=1 Tax=Algoriphagus terrigena TaxID=344884 RepID=UPI00047BBFAF|nr:nuclear transport factor 2 family protein [Algoriphagus terrigena]
MNDTETVISNYITAYNNFDVSTMVRDFSDEIIFENIQDGKITMSLHGIEAFIEQAETSKNYFSVRNQKITAINCDDNRVVVEVEFKGVLAMDFPNGMNKGQEIRMVGKSIFEFKDQKIVRLTDLS